jgi:hypothetical protein
MPTYLFSVYVVPTRVDLHADVSLGPFLVCLCVMLRGLFKAESSAADDEEWAEMRRLQAESDKVRKRFFSLNLQTRLQFPTFTKRFRPSIKGAHSPVRLTHLTFPPLPLSG